MHDYKNGRRHKLFNALRVFLSFRLSLDTKCFGSYCWYCSDKCFCLNASGLNYSSIDSSGKIVRYCTSNCYEALNKSTSLKLATLKLPGDLESSKIMKLKAEVSGMIIGDDPASVVHSTLIIYIKEEDLDSFPASVFYQSRTYYLQTFYKCSNYSNVPELLNAMGVSNVGVDGLIGSTMSMLITSFQQSHVLTASEFRYKLMEEHELQLSHAITDSCLPVPLLKSKILDMTTLLQEANDKPEQVKKDIIKSYIISESQFMMVKENLPPNCALTVEFVTDNREVKFDCRNDSNYSEEFCLIAEQASLILISRVNVLLKTPFKEDNKLNEDLYKCLSELYAKIEMCLRKLPTSMKQNIADHTGNMDFLIHSLPKLTSLLFCGKTTINS